MRRIAAFTAVLVVAACSPEKQVPPPAPQAAAQPTPAPTPAPTPTPTATPTATPTTVPAPAPAATPVPAPKPAQAPAPAATPVPAPKPAPAPAAIPSAAPASTHARIGPEKCKMCHKLQYDSWAASPHKAKGLECEHCHGPGGDYAKMSVMKDRAQAVAAGLVFPDVAFCRKCHPGAGPDRLPKAHAHKQR